MVFQASYGRDVDAGFRGESYYDVQVTQGAADQHGNPSRAWSSPMWVSLRSE